MEFITMKKMAWRIAAAVMCVSILGGCCALSGMCCKSANNDNKGAEFYNYMLVSQTGETVKWTASKERSF